MRLGHNSDNTYYYLHAYTFAFLSEFEYEVIVDFRISWRRSYGGLLCTDEMIADGTLVGGQGDVECFENCNGDLGHLSVQCTDFSVDEDWSSGRGRIQAIVPPTDTDDVVQFG